MMDLVQLLGATLGLAAGLGLWFWRRRKIPRYARDDRGSSGHHPLSSRAQREGPLHEVRVQGPLLHEIPGGRYEIGDNSATRAEIDAWLAGWKRAS